MRVSRQNHIFLFLLGFIFLYACQKDSKLFKRVESSHSNITFENRITETDSFNILFDEFMYNGGGVGMGDFNNDGLEDIYFTGNQVNNKLYLNKGNFKFEDVTAQSNTLAEDIWSSGVSVVDINNDGWVDIYISATHDKDPRRRRNKLFINEKSTESPVFSEQSKQYGLADSSYTTHSVFFDYDLDGDLDVFMLIDEMILKRSSTIQPKITDGSSQTTDKLFRNDGGIFIDVSKEAGILIEGFGLGVAVLDVNEDKFPDLYVSNDFITNDVLYVNNGDGTFSDQISDYIKHQSYSSMGNDVADINNDGKLDIMTLDMLPNTNQRLKQMMNQTRYLFYDLMEKKNYDMQYVRNCLHVNTGGGFSEVGLMAGVGATDWSWSVLLADYDLDGSNDIFITNGFPKDVTDLDFSDFRVDIKGRFSSTEVILSQIPEVKINNFFFSNRNGLKFDDVSSLWGIDEPSFSNGAAYGDLDNDGDLDLVVNNINQEAFLYENRANSIYANRNSLRLQMKGPKENINSIGAKIWVKVGSDTLYKEHYPYRGYISSVQEGLHFGVGEAKQVDWLKVEWGDGRSVVKNNLAIEELIILDYKESVEKDQFTEMEIPTIFQWSNSDLNIRFSHFEEEFQDFRIQVLLPRKHSREGPSIAVGDIDSDGDEDFFVGNGRGKPGVFFSQNATDQFESKPILDTTNSEDVGTMLFDADNDGDLDLYICSGSSEYEVNSVDFQDRLYFNDGLGNFVLNGPALPENFSSNSTINAADFDRDGDLDLFVGGRLVPQSYPMPASSQLLLNENGRFENVNSELAPMLDSLGMVTSAIWSDFDQDGWTDLIVVGEWMPITFLKNESGKLVHRALEIKSNGNQKIHTTGWWNSIVGADFDKDGDVDYIVGNQGLNNHDNPSQEHPLKMFAKDFDKNGSIDYAIGAWRETDYYPMHFRNDLIRQMNFLRKKYLNYEIYANEKFENIFSKEDLDDALYAEASLFETVLLENRNGSFILHELPREAQFAPVHGIQVMDVAGDDNLDVVLIGNRHHSETFTGRHDALNGLILEGDGQLNFKTRSLKKNGFVVKGDGRALACLVDRNGNQLILASQNGDELLAFKENAKGTRHSIPTNALDARVVLEYDSGDIELRELYYGSGYLSQSSRKVIFEPETVKKITITDFNDHSRIAWPSFQ